MHERAFKTTLELDPAESEFGFALVMCMLAHNLLRLPLPMKILDPPPCLANIYLFENGHDSCMFDKKNRKKEEKKMEREKK